MNELIAKAEAFAARAHAGTERKFTGEPYIMHPRAVADRVAQLPDATEEMIAAAWLHDVVEDTDYSVADIEREFGPVIAGLVGELTNPSKDHKDLPRAERKAMDRAHIATVSPQARRIKLLDRIHNLSCRMDQAPREFAERYLAETELMLAESLTGVDAELEAELREIVAAAIKALQGRGNG